MQGRAGSFVAWMRGSYSGVVGLPLAETATLLLRAEYGWALAAIALHVGTSTLATLAGVALVGWLATPTGGVA